MMFPQLKVAEGIKFLYLDQLILVGPIDCGNNAFGEII
ncbi:hypothetical protein ADICYQ_3188 [Cyclobacterium qasimii M12-11B]|uniref:Uncharacterized protein n=1 Tax=Cyclobacterium qasimii M12-11B TaxID=641524 RepID=S7VE05_9BACT|nr:hypothetical protein ADICYQ_3188 [Cyclobacterium qasimii M12-11B]